MLSYRTCVRMVVSSSVQSIHTLTPAPLTGLSVASGIDCGDTLHKEVTAVPFGSFGQGSTCVFGRVTVIPTGLVGAVIGIITTLSGQAIQFRQVVGPTGGTVSVNNVNGQFATLCGNIVLEQGQVILNVTAVLPGTAGLAGTGVLNQNLLALLQLGGLGGLGGLTGLGALGSAGTLGSLLGSGI